MIRRKWAAAALVAVLTLVAAGCSKVGSGSGSNTPSSSLAPNPANANVTIKIAVNDWVGSAANAGLASDLLQKLGYKVDLVHIDEFAQFPALARGQLDATLEVWPSGHGKDYTQYITGKAGVVDGGKLGVTGQIGWWVPTYMVTAHPELATWQGLKTDWAMFKTTESGSQGQLLDGDPSYVTFDGEIAKALGLNYKVIYAGSEAAELTALDAAYSKQGPILMYFWTPHWAQAKYKLTMVQLPPVTQACTDAANNNNGKGYACGYPPDALYKAFNDQLQTKAPQAFALLSALNYTNDDQNSIGLAINLAMKADSKLTQEAAAGAAAQAWIAANQSKWAPWIASALAVH